MMTNINYYNILDGFIDLVNRIAPFLTNLFTTNLGTYLVMYIFKPLLDSTHGVLYRAIESVQTNIFTILYGLNLIEVPTYIGLIIITIVIGLVSALILKFL